MSTHPVYQNVLVPTDQSARAAQALPHAFAAVAPAGTIHLVTVLHDLPLPNPMYAHYGPPALTPDERELRKQAVLRELEELARGATVPSGVHVRCHVFEDIHPNPADRICRAADELGADLVCIASHGRTGLRRALLGSVAERVVRHCRVPTLVARIADEDLVPG